jgi:hypothetical protein
MHTNFCSVLSNIVHKYLTYLSECGYSTALAHYMRTDVNIRERIIRVPMDIDLIRRMDGLILRRQGGFDSRAEFIREAVEALLVELSYEPAPDLIDGAHQSESVVGEIRIGSNGDGTLGFTALSVPKVVSILEHGIAQPVDEMLWGLHNRDYPSLWAAATIGELTDANLMAIEDCVDLVAKRAWKFGRDVLDREPSGGMKLSALFPTNDAKPQSAESAFRAHAIGGWTGKTNDITAWGPLFTWQVCQIARDPQRRLVIGLSAQGAELLRQLSGISLELPHSQQHSRSFLSHLRRWAPADHRGFQTALQAAADRADRPALVAHFTTALPQASETVAATYAAGYIARCREWGLVEPKQTDGRYQVTDFGRQLLGHLEEDSK